MKVLFFLFLVFISYSYSIDLQYINIGDNSPKSLRSSKNYDYFYFSIKSYVTYYQAYLLISDDGYNIIDIYYCPTSSYPTDTVIDTCGFFSVYYYIEKKTSSGTLYYYKIPISNMNKPYVIIQYRETYSYGKFKARCYFTEKVSVDSNEIELSTLPKTYNDFYTDISNPSSDYIYFNISDLNDNLNQPLYYCKTDKNPEYYEPTSNCSLVILNYYDKKDSNGKYEYYYTVDTSSYRGTYIVIRYYVNHSSGSLYARSSYRDPSDHLRAPSSSNKNLSTLGIVFIAIAAVAFIGIIITIVYYYCRKEENSNVSFIPNEPTVVISAPNLVIENNIIPS